jgi:hypothetical protein
VIAVFVMKAFSIFVEISKVTKMAKTAVLRWVKAARQGSVFIGVNGYRVEWELHQ